MYKKGMIVLLAGYLLLSGMIFAFEKRESGQETQIQEQVSKEWIGIARYSSSERRVVELAVLENAEQEDAKSFSEVEEETEMKSFSEVEEGMEILSEEERTVLQRIVEAEAGGEDAKGKQLVANVVLNRVASEDFPNTISEVVFQESNGVTQFSPVKNGRFYTVSISEETKQAVERALQGEDLSDGALYFAARKYANKKSMKWFDEKLCFLFQYGNHEFFK